MNLNQPYQAQIDCIEVYAYKIPCESKESDGTLEWSSTTMILVTVHAGNYVGIGYTYGHESCLSIIKNLFSPLLKKASVFDHPLLWNKMIEAVRNDGLSGIAANAISAVDTALWDLKGKILDMALCQLFGMARKSVPLYGSGGFTSYLQEQIIEQFLNWKSLGINRFKMKVGRNPDQDPERVKSVRQALGSQVKLMVDANGAYNRKQALELANMFADAQVDWFEEPVSSDDLEGLRLICAQAPAGMNITAGEYGYEPFYFRRMLEAQAVDILQADVTRCLGYTGFLQVAHICHSFNLPLSSHTAPCLHLPVCLNLSHVCHMEYFYDHVRIEQLFFDGFPRIEEGAFFPHLDKPGHGLSLKESTAKQYLIDKEII